MKTILACMLLLSLTVYAIQAESQESEAEVVQLRRELGAALLRIEMLDDVDVEKLQNNKKPNWKKQMEESLKSLGEKIEHLSGRVDDSEGALENVTEKFADSVVQINKVKGDADDMTRTVERKQEQIDNLTAASKEKYDQLTLTLASKQELIDTLNSTSINQKSLIEALDRKDDQFVSRLGQVETTQAKLSTAVAFSAARYDDYNPSSPYIVSFNSATYLNQGNAFNGSKFRAPIKGLYYFSLFIMSESGKAAPAYIRLNGSSKGRAYAYRTSGVHQNAGTAVTLSLDVGDQVWVYCQGELDSFGNYFTGHLITAL